MEEEKIEDLGELLQESPKIGEVGICLPKKFGTVDELVRAYEQLEKEFTRKSQALSAVEKQGKASVAIEEKPSVKMTDNKNREEIIKEYLTSVAATPKAPTVITGQGDLAFGMKSEPRTLRDMEKVAENFFKLKEK